jgi:8-oxo-dGTP diphosphatase
MGSKENNPSKGAYYPIVLGIIFDPKKKKILIGKRNDPKDFPGLSWAFPGGRPEHGEELEDAVKREIKEETNYDVESLGVIFAKTYPEKRDLLAIYFLCEIVGGKENPNEDFSETKWVSPDELGKYFETSFHPKLKEYLEGLVN